jgi:hypothetical protein
MPKVRRATTPREDEDYAVAKENVARAGDLVASQQRRLEALKADGHDTTNAEAFLRVLRETREVMRRYLETVRAEARAGATEEASDPRPD